VALQLPGFSEAHLLEGSVNDLLEVDETIDHAPSCGGCDGERIECWKCGGEGFFDLHEDDPLAFAPGEQEACEECRGRGFYKVCWAWPRREA
jgi:DnaJ-class molecular chaperone